MNATLASGFETPPIEIVIFIIAIVGALGILVGYAIARNRRRTRQRQRVDTERYHELVDRLGLTPSEENVVTELAHRLEERSRRHLLLQNQGIFNQAATLAIEDGDATDAQISALRVKLGFSGHPVGLRPRSSVEIPSGSTVLVDKTGRSPTHARVQTARTDALVVALDSDTSPFTEGSAVTVIYQNEAGVFHFESTVLRHVASALELQHSEHVTHVQQRAWYRRRVRLPVYVRSASSDGRAIRTEFVDIGGGGASLENPAHRFTTGDQVELTFHPDGDASLNLSARVVRLSQSGSVIHVRYGNIRESQRDRLFALLFSRRR